MNKQKEYELRKQAADRGYNPQQINQFIEFAKQKEMQPTQPVTQSQPKNDGFFRMLVKDPLETLIVKPGTRIGQSIASPFVTNQQDTNSYQRNALSDQVLKTIEAAKGESDPSKKAQLIAKAKELNKQLIAFGNESIEISNRAGQIDDTMDVATPVGSYKVEGQRGGVSGAKQIAGDAAKTASYLYTPAKGAKVVKAGLKGAIKEGVVQGAKTGAAGGASYSAGQALIDDKSAGDIVKDAVTGAVIGAGAGGAIGGAVPVVARGAQKVSQLVKDKTGFGIKNIDDTVRNKIVNEVESKYDELFTGTKTAKKTYSKSTAQGKTPSRFLAEHGFIVDIDGGKVNVQSTIDKITKQAEPLEDVLDDLLKAKSANPNTSRISLDELGAKAKQRISTESNKASGYLQKQYQDVDNLVASLKESFGDEVTLSQLNSIKRSQWQQSTVFDATRPSYTSDIHYSLGKEAKEIIETSVEEADIKGLNSYLGDHYDVIKNLRKIDGNTVKGGRLGKYFARTAGAVIGAHGGPLGSIAGALGGDFVAGVMQNNYITTPIKKMMLERITRENPLYSQAQKALNLLREENFSRSMNTKSLPAPSFMPASPRTYESTPPKLLEAERGTGRDPKTGRIFRYYKSTGN